MRARIWLALSLVALMLLPAASPALAAANCSKGAIWFYEDANGRGIWVKSCYGQDDPNFSDGITGVSGYTSSNWHDRLSSFTVTGDGSVGVCLYRNNSYSSNWHASTANQPLWNIDIFNNDETDSYKWAAISPLNGRAAC